MRTYGEWKYSSTILLGTRLRWVVSFTPLPFYPRCKNPRYPLCRRLGGLQGRSGRYRKERILIPMPGIEPRFLGSPSRHYTGWAIAALVGRIYVYRSERKAVARPSMVFFLWKDSSFSCLRINPTPRKVRNGYQRLQLQFAKLCWIAP
jgi:hypothetical protein